MSGKSKNEPFAMLPRGLLESLSWRSLSIHSRRLLDYLILEHMRHGGKNNGRLLAPQRQLIAFGIHAHFVATAIKDAERVGVLDCKRGVGRRPSLYGLTWLPRAPGEPPTDRWRQCEAAAIALIAERKRAKTRPRSAAARAKVQSLRMHALCSENDYQSAVTKQVKSSQSACITREAKVHALSRISYQGEAQHGLGNGAAGAPQPARPAASRRGSSLVRLPLKPNR
jgi:hypothetical protein